MEREASLSLTDKVEQLGSDTHKHQEAPLCIRLPNFAVHFRGFAGSQYHSGVHKQGLQIITDFEKTGIFLA